MLKHVMDYLTGNDQKEDERRSFYGELPQGQRYLNNKRVMEKNLSSDLLVVEAFMNPSLPDLQYQKDDDDNELTALKYKFDNILSQYGHRYKDYMENVNNYILNQNSRLAGKNIQTPDGRKYYVTTTGNAKYYSNNAWRERSSSCRKPVNYIASNDLSKYKLTHGSSMQPLQPCNMEERNVYIPQLTGGAPLSSCSSYGSCPSQTIAKPLNTRCAQNPCTKKDCCIPLPTCSSYKCPHNMIKKLSPRSINCEGGACSNKLCCTQKDTCSGFSCGNGYTVRSPSTLCNGLRCSKKECCNPNPTCNRYTCGNLYTQKNNAKNIRCKSSTCTRTECCQTILPSGVKNCNNGWFSKVSSSNVNASAICKKMGYSGTVDKWGGNWGKQCGGISQGSGGSPTSLGYTVGWHCT